MLAYASNALWSVLTKMDNSKLISITLIFLTSFSFYLSISLIDNSSFMKFYIWICYSLYCHCLRLECWIQKYAISNIRLDKIQPGKAGKDLLIDIQSLVIVSLVIWFIAFDFSVISDKDQRADVV